MKQKRNRLRALVQQNDGSTSIEYAVLLSLICGAVMSSVGILSMSVKQSFNDSGTAVNQVLGGSP